MKIVLINPPTPNLKQGKGVTNHIGLEYISSYLNKKGYYADIIEAPKNNLSFKKICDILEKEQYDIVGISVYSYNYRYAIKISKIAKKLGASFVFWGGYLPTLLYKKLDREFEYVNCMVVGEGEITDYRLIRCIELKKEWKNIKGLVYKENGEIVFSGKADLIFELDELPFPQRINDNSEIVNVITSRGCYANCSFCAIKEFYNNCIGKSVRFRSAENVYNEVMDIVKKNSNVKVINFNDDNFTLSSEKRKKWFERFLILMENSGISIRFSCLLRANEIIKGEAQIKEFKKIGLKYVFVGIESFIESHLRLYNKRTTVEQNIRALKILEELDIQINIGFLLFNPVTTLADIKETIKIFRKINFNKKNKFYIKPISYSPVIITEGSMLFNFIKAKGLEKNNYLGYSFLNKETEICFKEVERWNEHVKLLCEKNYLEEEILDKQLLKNLREQFYSLFILDLNFLESISDIIERNLKNKEMYNALDLNYKNKIEEIEKISKKISIIEKEAKKYHGDK